MLSSPSLQFWGLTSGIYRANIAQRRWRDEKAERARPSALRLQQPANFKPSLGGVGVHLLDQLHGLVQALALLTFLGVKLQFDWLAAIQLRKFLEDICRDLHITTFVPEDRGMCRTKRAGHPLKGPTRKFPPCAKVMPHTALSQEKALLAQDLFAHIPTGLIGARLMFANPFAEQLCQTLHCPHIAQRTVCSDTSRMENSCMSHANPPSIDWVNGMSMQK